MLLTKVESTESVVMFAAAILFARSAAELPTSSFTFVAACSIVWLPGRPETDDAAVRITTGRATSRRRAPAQVSVKNRIIVVRVCRR
jgi:hypothetical protein